MLVLNSLPIMHQQFVVITLQTYVTITCGIQPTGVATKGVEVLHNSCNMCICDSPDMYAQSLTATGLRTEYQVNPMHMLQLLH